MDDDAYQRLNRIAEQLMELCRWVIEKRDVATASRLIPITEELTRLVAEVKDEKKILSCNMVFV
jgi:uncharacterized protein YicC (UPF0701 family)